jgi:hypothetical protein
MWRRQDGKAVEAQAVPGGEMPCHESAPVMADEVKAPEAGSVGETEHVEHELVDAVRVE